MVVTLCGSDAKFELLKWYFVEVDDDTGFDAATEVIARAMANLAPGTRARADGSIPAIEAPRDLLDLPARVHAVAIYGNTIVAAAGANITVLEPTLSPPSR